MSKDNKSIRQLQADLHQLQYEAQAAVDKFASKYGKEVTLGMDLEMATFGYKDVVVGRTYTVRVQTIIEPLADEAVQHD